MKLKTFLFSGGASDQNLLLADTQFQASVSGKKNSIGTFPFHGMKTAWQLIQLNNSNNGISTSDYDTCTIPSDLW